MANAKSQEKENVGAPQAGDQPAGDQPAAAQDSPAESKAGGTKAKKPVKHSLRAKAGGPMVNPLTEDTFTGEPSKPVEIDAWIQMQIDDGKMEVVED